MFVIDDKNGNAHVGPLASIFFGKITCPRQYDLEFGKLPGLCFHVDLATMLFHDDVVRHREAKSSPFTGRLGREEWVEHLFLNFCRDTRAVVTNANLHCGSEVLRGSPQGWL